MRLPTNCLSPHLFIPPGISQIWWRFDLPTVVWLWGIVHPENASETPKVVAHIFSVVQVWKFHKRTAFENVNECGEMSACWISVSVLFVFIGAKKGREDEWRSFKWNKWKQRPVGLHYKVCMLFGHVWGVSLTQDDCQPPPPLFLSADWQSFLYQWYVMVSGDPIRHQAPDCIITL